MFKATGIWFFFFSKYLQLLIVTGIMRQAENNLFLIDLNKKHFYKRKKKEKEMKSKNLINFESMLWLQNSILLLIVKINSFEYDLMTLHSLIFPEDLSKSLTSPVFDGPLETQRYSTSSGMREQK